MKFFVYIILSLISIQLLAETKTFLRDYNFKAGEADSKISSRAIALEQVKRILLEEIGVYLRSSITTTVEEKDNIYNELTKQEVQSITAGITETKIIEEKWDGENYYIKVEIIVDPEIINSLMLQIGTNKSELEKLVNVMKKAEEAYAEIERLRKELTLIKSENEKLHKKNEYLEEINRLSATDWFQKAYNADLNNNYDDAIKYYQKVIELNPNDFINAYFNLAMLYRIKGESKKCNQLLETAIGIFTEKEETYLVLGEIYAQKQNYNKAIQMYELALKFDPQDLNIYILLIQAFYLNKNYSKATEVYENAVKIYPETLPVFGVAFFTISWSYFEIKNYEKAIKYFLEWYKISNRDVDMLIGLSLSYYQLNEYSKAKQYLDEAKVINPCIEDGMNGIAKLEGEGYSYNDNQKEILSKMFDYFKK